MNRRIITGGPFAPILDFVFPPICLACGCEERPGPLKLGLCLPCRGRLKLIRGRPCTGCGRPLAAAALPAGYLCGDCRRRPPAFDRLLAVWSYEPPLLEVIHALKFGRLDFLGGHLAEEIWHRIGGDLRPAEVIVAVPLHWRRQMTRGYNQAERIARPLADRLGRPLVAALRRVRPTQPQARLERSRRQANLRQAFRCRLPLAIRHRQVLLVDDVSTTGATLDHAATTLRRAGAASVLALTAARTPARWHGTSPPGPLF
jgi:ComF family protein